MDIHFFFVHNRLCNCWYEKKKKQLQRIPDIVFFYRSAYANEPVVRARNQTYPQTASIKTTNTQTNSTKKKHTKEHNEHENISCNAGSLWFWAGLLVGITNHWCICNLHTFSITGTEFPIFRFVCWQRSVAVNMSIVTICIWLDAVATRPLGPHRKW